MNYEIQTVIRDWYIIKVIDPGTMKRVGQILWGYVVEDRTLRFDVGYFICTSAIEKIKNNVITTAKSSEYVVIGSGKEFEAYFDEVDMLRRGYSPDQVKRLRDA